MAGKSKGTANSSNKNNNELINLIKTQQEQISKLTDEINNLKNNNIQTSVKIVGNSEKENPFDSNRLVTVVHMDDLIDGLCTYVKGDFEYRFTKISDKHRIRLIELEKIMSKYKKFFEIGILIIAEEDINDYFTLNKTNFISIDTYKNIYKLTPEKLKEIYESVCATHQDMIIRHWFLEYEKVNKQDVNANNTYADFSKILVLNQCSNNKLNQLINDLMMRNSLKKDK